MLQKLETKPSTTKLLSPPPPPFLARGPASCPSATLPAKVSGWGLGQHCRHQLGSCSHTQMGEAETHFNSDIQSVPCDSGCLFPRGCRMPAGIALHEMSVTGEKVRQVGWLLSHRARVSSLWPAHLKGSLSKAGLFPGMDSIPGTQERRSLNYSGYLCKGRCFNVVGRMDSRLGSQMHLS